MTTAFDYVLYYAERGWRVFPIAPHSKQPLFPSAHEKGNPCKGECGRPGHGLHDATNDASILREWWARVPNANIGLATGKASGFFVYDVDPEHEGNKTHEAHIQKHGAMPKTIMSQTGSGGNHYLFKMPELDIRNSSGKLGAGLDTRGNGGYIVAPFSIHPNGNEYKWLNQPSRTELAESPEWLLKMLFEQKIQQSVKNEAGALVSGQRNSTLTSLAGAMRRRGMDADSIFLALNAENLNKCVPPLPEDEVRAIALSVSRYTPQDAPNFQSRDRVVAEWAFCKTIYENPDYIQDFTNLQPNDFSDNKLAEWWADVKDGAGVALAAVNAEIMAELEKYNDWALPRVDEYAKTIKHYSRMSLIGSYGWRLQKASEAGDYEKIDRTVTELNALPPVTGRVVESVSDIAYEVERQIRERAANPVEVWGIPYAWKKISKHTGGKQLGELTLFAGEPKIGKSWWKLQDVLQTAIKDTPVFYWCGEMKKPQIMRRFYALLGVNPRRMKEGSMTAEDWEALNDAKALILNSPLHLDDTPLALHEVRPLLARMKAEYGIKEFVLDYAKLIRAPGKDEIEQTGNVSVEVKRICGELELAGTLIASVNKGGMDGNAPSKSNIRGSGQQIHDADVIYQLTSFPEKYGQDYGIMPQDYGRCVALNISAGREFEDILEGNFIGYMREKNTPAFVELTK